MVWGPQNNWKTCRVTLSPIAAQLENEMWGLFQSSKFLFWKHLDALLMPRLSLQCSCQVSQPPAAHLSIRELITSLCKDLWREWDYIKGLHLSLVFGSDYSFIHPSLHPSFYLVIISFMHSFSKYLPNVWLYVKCYSSFQMALVAQNWHRTCLLVREMQI